jgi:hypothetical protein
VEEVRQRHGRIRFPVFDNSSNGFSQGGVELATAATYTETRESLDEILDADYREGRVPEAVYRTVGAMNRRWADTEATVTVTEMNRLRELKDAAKAAQRCSLK